MDGRFESNAKFVNRRSKIQSGNDATINMETKDKGVQISNMIIQLRNFAFFQSTNLSHWHSTKEFRHKCTQILPENNISANKMIVVSLDFDFKTWWRQLYFWNDL